MNATQLADDERAKILASKRRHYVLAIADELPFDRVDVRALADDMAFIEAGGETPDDDQIDAAERALRHHHLPLLIEHGVFERVATQRDDNGEAILAAIEATDRADELADHVEHPTERGDA